MLSPRAIRLFLRYFDSIDETLSRRLVRKRTWDEEALTFLLTELLDQDAQGDHNLLYSHDDLIRDLAITDEPLAVVVNLETHSYNKSMERYVTQSDIGIILSYEDQFNNEASFRRGWLFQAKRLFPSQQRYEYGFTENSRFNSVDSDQHDRMKALRDWAKCDFIRYLLYCPRPASLERSTREKLNSARTSALALSIFDYALGLQLRDDFLSESSTVAAGIFVSFLDDLPDNLLSVHESLFGAVTPFSWFIVAQLAQTGGISNRQREMGRHENHHSDDKNLNNPIIEGLIRGDCSVLKKDETLIDILENVERSAILPAHTVTIKVINGIDRPRRDNDR
jgi:hypothetical protein